MKAMKNLLALLFAWLLMLAFQSSNNVLKYTNHYKQADSLRIIGSTIFLDNTYLDVYKKNSDARALYQKALGFTQAYLEDADLHFMRLRILYNIGATYFEQNNYEVALDNYDVINENLLKYKSALDSISLYTLLKFNNTLETARTYAMMGELEMANLFFEEADNMALKNPDKIPDVRCIRLYTDFSDLLRRKERFRQAEEVAFRGLLLMNKSIDILGKADLYMNLANTLHDAKRYDEAEKYFLQALNLYEGKSSSNVVRCYKNLGESYRKNNKLAAAEKILSGQITAHNNNAANKIYDRGDIIALYINRGETRYDAKKYKEASADYQKALEWLQFKPNTEGVFPPIDSFNGNRFYLLMVLNDMALMHIKLKEPRKALNLYDNTITQLVNIIRRDYIGEEDKMGVSGKTRSIIEKAVNVCITLYQQYGDIKFVEQAFNFSEQSKAMTLLENAKLKETAALSNIDKEKLAQIKYYLSEIEKKIAIDSANADNIAELRRLNTEKREIWQNAKKSIEFNSGQLATLQQVQENLSDNQALIEYFIEKQDSNRLHTFLVQKNKPVAYTVVRIDNSFEPLIDSMATYLSQSHNRHEKQYCETAYALYQFLIEPIKNNLPQRVIIIPEYPLSKIPFSALITQPNITNYAAALTANAFWDKAITYNYSANLHNYMMRSAPDATRSSEKVVTVAPSFNDTKGSLSATLPQPIQLTVIREKFNEQEANAISRLIKTHDFHDEKATKDNLMKACEDKNNTVMHISTHGILMNNPKLSFISMTQKTSQLDTGQLIFLSDLYNNVYLKNLNLVFLSACETGISNDETYKGEGMLSMAWGLASAGVKSFVTTLWSVNAQQTSILTPLFYKAMSNNATMTKDMALIEAQKTYLTANPEKANPYYWAGFILVGNTKGLVFDKPSTGFSGLMMTLVGSLVALFGWFFYKRRKK